jgi:hypothetical protein
MTTPNIITAAPEMRMMVNTPSSPSALPPVDERGR